MVTRWHLTVVVLCTLLVVPAAHPEIYRWDTGEVIPGTEGIEPGPGVDLSVWNTDQQNLRYADFSGGTNLTDAKFYQSWLDYADFGGAILFDAHFGNSTLTGANLAGANLANGYLQYSDLTGADLSGTDLTDATLLRSRLADANLTGAVVKGVDFYDTTSGGFTEEQLYSTASYHARDLRHIRFAANDFTGWDLSGQDLSHASLAGTTLTDANLTGVVVKGATLGHGLVKEQLYSTASYQEKNLREVWLGGDLSGWDLREQDLTGAFLSDSELTDANLAGANLTNVSFHDSSLTNTNFAGSTIAGTHWRRAVSDGFTEEQLYSTASYQAGNLQGIEFSRTSLEGWNLSGQDLSLAYFNDVRLVGADLRSSNLATTLFRDTPLRDADLRGANLKNAIVEGGWSLESAIVDSSTVYNQWTSFPSRFDPVAAGLTLEPSPEGDFTGDDELGVSDIDLLVESCHYDWRGPDRYWLLRMFDLNSDQRVDKDDHRIWVKDLKQTWYGDANLDGEFDSGDMTQVFAAGKYEKGWLENLDVYVIIHNGAGWDEGDWNGDGFFDSSDMVTAFVDGGYEQGPRANAAVVPEPGGWLLLVMGLLPWLFDRRLHRLV